MVDILRNGGVQRRKSPSDVVRRETPRIYVGDVRRDTEVMGRWGHGGESGKGKGLRDTNA